MGADVNAQTLDRTPLHDAAQGGHVAIAKLLIANGADINAKALMGQTPLRLAKENRHKEMVELLKRHGAKE